MAIEIKLPALGDNIDSGDVLEVKVHEGDMIQKDQGILEIETDKATVEVPSSHAGKVLKVHIREGESIPIGAPLITLEESAGAAEAAEAPAAPPSRKAPAAQETPPPKAAKPAAGAPAPAKPREPEAPSETRKGAAPAPMEAQAKEAEAVKKPPAASAPSPPAEPRSRPAASTPANPPSTPAATTGGGVAAGPSVRRFAREVGVDLSGVAGSGPHGRVTRDDVLSVVRTVNEVARGKSASGEGSKAAEETGEHDAWGPVRLEKLTKIRKTIASKMSESWSTATRVTNFDDADVTELDRLRQSSKGDYAADGIKLTSLPFVIKAVAMSLKKHVTINASIDLDNGQIIYKNYVNVGVAVDTDRGLVVPSLRHADKVSIPEIARQLAAMAENVRQGNFSIDDLRGSTFTISNLGSVGGTYSTPMINVPEVAILLLGRSRRMPVAINDQVVVRLMMPLSLSYDHRLVDGAAAARFLNEVKGLLEAPSRLLLAP